MDFRKALLMSATSVALLCAASGTAVAQAKYPTKNIEVVVPFAPGGGTDNMMRMITGIMDENKWAPMPVNVNNRPGGSGTIGYMYLINKKGDSHVIAGATPMIVSGKLQGACRATIVTRSRC
jgi:putative tricarboxylic transport membrane protein